ncbi:probable 2-oxoglutarate-dependent dioxygenase aop1.2 [Phtheirospermum japonicum]|nr:probable 2-oxoglutarate-dependent dioxygenase aop1.2 [Phtheirospermum japonicum]
MGSHTVHKLPIIKFTDKNSKHGTESWSKACNEVISALEEYGCFVALYDKITQEIHNGVFEAMQELFDLPTHIKVQNKSTKPLYGYVGQIPLIPLYESMGIDNANTLQGLHNFTKVMWPNGNEGFSENIHLYTKLAAELEKIVVQMVFESYGVEKYYESHIGSANYLCRVMKYREPEIGENKMGFVSHTDKSFMSTIHQNHVDGLEIQAKDGEWFDVRELLSPSSVVVMAGDAIMAWSNDRIKSPHHRVSMEGKEARYSIAQFSFMEKIVQTPRELINDEHPLRYKPFDHLKFLEFYSKEDNRKLESAIRTYCGV